MSKDRSLSTTITMAVNVLTCLARRLQTKNVHINMRNKMFIICVNSSVYMKLNLGPIRYKLTALTHGAPNLRVQPKDTEIKC